MKQKVWARLGATLSITSDDLNVLALGGDDAEELLKKIVRDGDFVLDGESYIPATSLGVDDNEHPVKDEIVVDVTPDQNEVIEYRGICYEVTDEIPEGYQIWPIGPQNAPPGYVPICRLVAGGPIEYGETSYAKDLKVIRSAGAYPILKTASAGHGTLSEMLNFAGYARKPGYGSITLLMRDAVISEEAIPYMEKLNGVENLIPIGVIQNG